VAILLNLNTFLSATSSGAVRVDVPAHKAAGVNQLRL